MTRVVELKFEIFNAVTGAVVFVGTRRKAINRLKKEDYNHFVRRQKPMVIGDLYSNASQTIFQRALQRRFTENGFWQPTGYDHHVHRYLYWY